VRGSGTFCRSLLASGAVALLLAACSSGHGTPETACTPAPAAPAAGNALQNGGFEAGRDPWTSLTTPDWGRPFVVSPQRAHSGSNSAYLRLRSEDGGTTKVYGVVQEISPAGFPETLSGYYCVDRWEKGTARQYLQFAIIVNNASNIPQEVKDLGASNHQIRYILAGVDTQPTNIANSRYVFISKEPPKIGQWVHFERNIRQDFSDLWGSTPTGFTSIRVFFETRWDERAASDGPSVADVYYDDLYWGPASGAPDSSPPY
jgi:hypothetical protein